MKYISAKEAAEKWSLTKRRVLVLCKEGRISGAELVGSTWVIPEDALKPEDGRALRYQKEGSTSSDVPPLKSSVKAKGHTPQYKMHKYFARRPYNVFSHLIKHYTSKGDIILDCFCGGGVTIFESAHLGRKPIGVDINPLAAFITRMQLFNGEVSELNDCYRRFLLTIEKKYSEWYQVIFDDDKGIASWTEWAYTVQCPDCGETIVLLEENKASNGVYRCPNSGCVNHNVGVKRILCRPLGSEPIRVKYTSSVTNKQYTRDASIENFPAFKKINFSEIIAQQPYKPEFQIPENWDRQYEDRLQEKGIVEYSDFFTERNFALNCLIFNEIMKLKGTTASELNEYLYFLFSSSLRYTNKMTRVTDNWEGGKPTAMDKHAFWLPNQYVETNIIDVLKQRAKAIIRGCEYSAESIPKDVVEVTSFEDIKLRNSYMILNQDASNLPIPSNAVDVVITDPPYGSNVQYAELSTIWNAWYAIYKGLDNYIYKDKEAVMNRKRNFKGSKTVDDYEELLCAVYTECARTLKPNGYLVFTFNNKNLKVWIAMLKAVARAGFYLPEDGVIFQDYIDSYKNTAHLRFSGNIQGDFIYSFRKGSIAIENTPEKGLSEIIDESIDETVSKLFKRRKKHSTPDLYQKVLADMTRKLMQYILWCLSSGKEMEDISSFSNDYLEQRLKQLLVCNNGVWEKKPSVFSPLTQGYNSPELKEFITKLENKYKLEKAQEKYHNLVNFSTNKSVPYHQWFLYREGFSNELITELIEMSDAAPGECIIDPFCGSGTTNVVASLNGYDTLGLDVNPMSAFITNAKIAHYSKEDLQKALEFKESAIVSESYSIKPGFEDVHKYFSDNNYYALLRIKTFIDSLTDSKAKDLLFVAYLSIIMDCSNRKRDGNGLKVRTTKVVSVPEYFAEKVEMIVQDIKEQQSDIGVKGYGIYDTAYNLNLNYNNKWGDISAGAIIFSPPYANSFDYFESYKLELVLGEFASGVRGINDLRKYAVRSFIGAEKQDSCDRYVDLIAREIENAIPEKEKETGKTDSRTRKVPNMIRGYFSDMREVIRQCSKCLSKGKKTYIVVDQSAYVGKIVPTDLLLAYFAELEGFKVGKVIECRNARTSTQQLIKYPYLKTTLRESIVELIKA
ncbi:MAG: hypothetical protein E7571_00805 [Ruminococcaceae bacterium]|nr:hypothetical protein [Oscillospiraceae bacterium]